MVLCDKLARMEWILYIFCFALLGCVIFLWRRYETQAAKLSALQVDHARVNAELESERRQAAEKIALLESAEDRLKKDFENLANKIFEHKGRVLTDQNQERLTGLLQPFRDQLEAFRVRVEEVHKNEAKQSVRLIEQVRALHELSNKVSDEANHLAQAIKGDTKTQGDWGEMIVERIFEASGLNEGEAYERQTSYRDDEGRLQRPDFTVKMPDGKFVFVDSKVSLTAYERYCNEADADAKASALKEHIASVRRHVDSLRVKDYTALAGNETLDFVIMCIPLESAFQLTMLEDRELVYDLARGNVVIAGPNTLMITLRVIAQIWRRENENRNAERIADEAGKLYDHVARIVDAMEDARHKLTGTVNAFDLVMNRMKDGRGNLISRVDKVREMGAKVSKRLPDQLVDEARANDA